MHSNLCNIWQIWQEMLMLMKKLIEKKWLKLGTRSQTTSCQCKNTHTYTQTWPLVIELSSKRSVCNHTVLKERYLNTQHPQMNRFSPPSLSSLFLLHFKSSGISILKLLPGLFWMEWNYTEKHWLILSEHNAFHRVDLLASSFSITYWIQSVWPLEWFHTEWEEVSVNKFVCVCACVLFYFYKYVSPSVLWDVTMSVIMKLLNHSSPLYFTWTIW